ncbi:MAG: hypothetical protein AAGD14_08665 [Planctomycetota bacterium]
MSTRRLAFTALFLGALIGLLAVSGLHRLGRLFPPERPQWEFTNHMLDAPLGLECMLRPGRVDQGLIKYWMVRRFDEPDPASIGTGPGDEVSRYPHVRAALSTKQPDEEGWFFEGVRYFPYRQLGAMTANEWLERIELVREVGEDGVRSRPMLVVRFGMQGGAESRYFYDPDRTEEETQATGLGWERLERHAPAQESEVYYLQPAGFREPPPIRDDRK